MATKKTPEAELPPGITEADLKWPKYEDSIPWEKRKELGLEDLHSFKFYLVKGRKDRGWVLTTLLIGTASRRARAGATTDRYYGIEVGTESIVRIGKGPHVLKEIEVHLSNKNIERLTKYVELWRKGMADAGSIRDRISSRRAQGQLYRAEGRTSWTW